MVVHPWWVLAAWMLLVGLGLPGALRAPSLLFSGTGDIAHSPSFRTDSLLRADFENPYAQLLALTLQSARWKGGDSTASDSLMIDAVENGVRALPEVGAVMTSRNILDKRLLPAPGTGALVLLGLKAETGGDAEKSLPKIRQAINAILAPFNREDTTLQWAVTGRAALTYDFNRFNSKDTSQAEKRAIPLTLLILILTFGSLVAAGIPVVIGVLSTTLSMSGVFILAHYWGFSNLVQNASSMIGLAVGVDYSLLFIQRYREILAGLSSGIGIGGASHPVRSNLQIRREALTMCMATAGKTVFYSGLTVMIGLLGLAFTPIVETRSIGWGGCLVVLIAMLSTLTLLPALLLLLGPALEWPRIWPRSFVVNTGRRWEAWSRFVMRHAPWAVLAGTAVILLMSYPGRFTRFGIPEGPFVPREMEFTRGYSMLKDMGLQGVVAPINIILTDTTGGAEKAQTANGARDSTPKTVHPAFTRERIPDLYAFARRIQQEHAVAHIFGPVNLSDDKPLAKYQMIYSDLDDAYEQMPFVKEFFISRDGRSLLMQIMLKPETPLEESKRIAKDIPEWLQVPGLRIDMGGQAVQNNDFDKAMASTYRPSLLFVFGVTFITLLSIFRAPWVAIKALVMNLFSVSAGYGAVVFVLQLGHGHALLGAPAASEVVPLVIPLLLFCILFGLSMDYEVFLLSRIREGFAATGDNAKSVAEGLAATGSVITSAASIMVAVFGVFAFSRMIVVQMLGLGLAVAVLVDATVIRVLLVPALMKLMGKWNWWPAVNIVPKTANYPHSVLVSRRKFEKQK